MTPEEKSLLERTYKLSEENNEILRSIRRSNRLGLAMRAIYWGFIIIASFGAYYFIQPYVTTLLGISGQMGGLEGIQNSLNNAQSAANSLKDLYK
jgi:hypothetical protein